MSYFSGIDGEFGCVLGLKGKEVGLHFAVSDVRVL